MITVNEAEKQIFESIGILEDEIVPIGDSIGRLLKEPINADRALPPFNRATVDGIAISSSSYHMGKTKLKVAGTLSAGMEQQALEHPVECYEIMTGAALPRGADCVVGFEDVEIDESKAKLSKGLPISPGVGVHYAGSDCKAGDVLLECGVVITAKEIAIAASVGKTEVVVSKRPSVAIVTTGDELVPIEDTPKTHQIRRSNGITLATALKLAGYPEIEVFHLPDDPEAIESKLGEILKKFDCLILAGGVSKGKFDYIPETLSRLGVAIRFQWVSQRPGKPMWYGQLHQEAMNKPVFALPGNPVSCFTCLRRYVIPALDLWTGKPTPKAVYIKLIHDLTFKPDITLFLPVKIDPKPSGEIFAQPILFNTSGDFVSVAKTDGFIELPKKRSVFPEGEAFRYFDWPR